MRLATYQTTLRKLNSTKPISHPYLSLSSAGGYTTPQRWSDKGTLITHEQAHHDRMLLVGRGVNLVDQVNAETKIGKQIRQQNVVYLLARVSTPRCIVVGVANGLEYLHFGVTPNVIHRDLKSDNILLDQDMEAGISDFRLATSILDSETSLQMPNNNGTLGYIDLEYFGTRVLRCSDVFSFGIFLAEMVTFSEMVTLMSPRSLTYTTLVQLINNIHNLAHPVREIDPTLIGSRHENQVLRVLNFAI
ncbi:leucine-rich repeat receptor-like serine/threonine/tyrosine-protein kinase SOBIR1, partial [Tanacetum coccineum]